MPTPHSRLRRSSLRGLLNALVAALPVAAHTLTALPAAAAPVTLYTNIDAPYEVDDPATNITATNWIGNQFWSLGYQFVISSVQLHFLETTDPADLRVDLYRDSSNSPGTFLEHFHALPDQGGFSTWALDSQPWLGPEASYWIVASARQGSTATASWAWTTTTPVGNDDPTKPNQYVAQSQYWVKGNGSTWDTPQDGLPYQMRVTVTAVPEPSSWAMGAAGLVCAGARALRRRSR